MTELFAQEQEITGTEHVSNASGEETASSGVSHQTGENPDIVIGSSGGVAIQTTGELAVSQNIIDIQKATLINLKGATERLLAETARLR